MTESSRRDFLRTLGIATVAAARPRLALAQEVRVRTIAGTGVAGYELEGSGGLVATQTPVNNPYGIVVGPDGALYFCEVDTGRIRRMDLETRRLTTVSGNGEAAYSGDGGPALAASFSAPHEIRFDRDGHLFVVERDAHVVRRVDAETGLVSTVAGTGEAGFSGDGGPAVDAQLRQPHSIAFVANGDLLICDIGNGRVRRVDMRSGTISTLSGTGERQPTPDTGTARRHPAPGATLARHRQRGQRIPRAARGQRRVSARHRGRTAPARRRHRREGLHGGRRSGIDGDLQRTQGDRLLRFRS